MCIENSFPSFAFQLYTWKITSISLLTGPSISSGITTGSTLAVTYAVLDISSQKTRLDTGKEYYPCTVNKRPLANWWFLLTSKNRARASQKFCSIFFVRTFWKNLMFLENQRKTPEIILWYFVWMILMAWNCNITNDHFS